MAADETIISELTPATSISDSDVMVIEDSVNTKKITAEKLAEYVDGKLDITFDKIAGGQVLSKNMGGTGNNEGYIRTGLKAGYTAGTKATAEGVDTRAESIGGHAEGYNTYAASNNPNGDYGVHAEGKNTYADSDGAHAEGSAQKSWTDESEPWESDFINRGNIDSSKDPGKYIMAIGEGTHAEGWSSGRSVLAISDASHAEGIGTYSYGGGSHSEGRHTEAKGFCSHAEGDKTVAQGYCSHAEGSNTIASDGYCHAEGEESKATYNGAHAEGKATTASGQGSHAEGGETTASGNYSHAEGDNTIASGYASHAGGGSCNSVGEYSFTHGSNLIANGYLQVCIGQCNVTNGTGTAYDASNKLFIIGNGTETNHTPKTRSNIFSVSGTGVYGTGTYNTSGADYAEMFEWKDGNTNSEDRAGKFVTLDGDKLVLATSSDDYILGVVSGKPSVCGDVADDQWNQMYLTDVYGRFLYEDIDYPEEKDSEGNVIREAQTAKRLKLNPSYDPTREYIPRSERPEWSPVGLLGKLVCIDDGTAEVNSYVTVNDDSIATAASERTKYRVMERLDENHIRIMIL